MITFITVE